MKLGLSLGIWGAGPPEGILERVRTAEELGFDSVWTGEAYGSDALTPLAWFGSRTERLRLGTSVLQLSARTPTATAMAAMTLDHLSGGRAAIGLGVSGPQVVEGWYGQPFPRPLERIREYVAIMRQVIARERVAYAGRHFQLPLEGGSGLGKSLRSTVHPLRDDLPLLLAAEGPKSVALAAEIADGWLPLFYAPADDAHYREALADGFARAGARRGPDDFEVACTVPVRIDDDVEAAADKVRPLLALYIGGMGAAKTNFHKAVFERMGYAAECERIQELYLAGRKADAAEVVTLEMVEKVALVGPRDKIAEDLEAWRKSLVTTMVVAADPETMRFLADLVG